MRLFDENDSPQADPRAATTHPATLDLLSDDGLADDMARVGLVAPIFQFWDRPTDSKVAEFDHAILRDDTQASRSSCNASSSRRRSLILKRVRSCECRGHVWARGDRRDAGCRQRDVTVRGPDGISTHRGAYVIGADGGRSTVRKASGIAVRRLHLAGTLHRVHHAVRFREKPRLLPAQLLRRPGCLVQLLQGRRPTARRDCGGQCSRPTPRPPRKN